MALNKPSMHGTIQIGDGGKILMVSLHVNDQIFTGNDESMFVKC